MTRITLWIPPEMRPAFRFLDENGNVVEEGPLLTADELYCDLCNVNVIIRPAPMIGSYVLCLECLQKIEPAWIDLLAPAILRLWLSQLDEFGQ